jgi:DNA helicase-2/ATP-dependent DNA helicase PcrA
VNEVDDALENLNEAQRAAVTADDGPVLVVAGAGTGKTRVIEGRVLNLMQRGAAPASIVLLTVTRRAAQQMLARAAARDPRAAGVQGGTFHAFAARLLREYAVALGLPSSFSILDAEDAATAVGRCVSRLGVARQTNLRFPRKETIRDILSKAANCRLKVDDVLGEDYPHYRYHASAMLRVQRAFAEYKLAAGCLDYDDLLGYLLALLRNDDVRERVSRRHAHLLVDEYQDSNPAQGEIVALLAQRHRSVMVVGDDAQSIYAFRGATRENLYSFERAFPGARVIKLEQNYRSTQAILDVANAMLGEMPRAYRKTLKVARHADGERPRFLQFRSAYEEAEWVAEEIKRSRDDDGTPLERIGVLYRSGYLSAALQMALAARQLPFAVFGGMRLTESAHVKDLAAHLRLAVNPMDVLAWARAMELLDGVGPRIAEKLSAGVPQASGPDAALDAVTKAAAGRPAGIRNRVARLGELVRAMAADRGPVRPKYDRALAYYRPILEARYDDWHRRLQDLDGIAQTAGRYAELEPFLADLALDPPTRSACSGSTDSPDDERPLTLSTVHSAKGLEWDNVYVVGLSDAIIPGRAAACAEETGEEARLLYVAVTRARRLLTLSMHLDGRGLGTLEGPCRFLLPSRVRRTLDGEGLEASATNPPARVGSPDADVLARPFALVTREELLKAVLGPSFDPSFTPAFDSATTDGSEKEA